MFLFASWLEGWTFKGRQKRFERDLQKEYSWLFEKFDGRIVPQKRYRQVLDYVEATVAVGDLLFEFVRGRGDFHVNVAPSHSPNDWLEFGRRLILLVMPTEPEHLRCVCQTSSDCSRPISNVLRFIFPKKNMNVQNVGESYRSILQGTLAPDLPANRELTRLR
jgi:hypothetical protein